MWHRVKVVPSVFLAGETSCTKRKYPRKAWRNITIFLAFFLFSLSFFPPSLYFPPLRTENTIRNRETFSNIQSYTV